MVLARKVTTVFTQQPTPGISYFGFPIMGTFFSIEEYQRWSLVQNHFVGLAAPLLKGERLTACMTSRALLVFANFYFECYFLSALLQNPLFNSKFKELRGEEIFFLIKRTRPRAKDGNFIRHLNC